MTVPLVSVILPLYNREHSVARAIRSVLDQTYRDIELIVVDDGSTDGSRAVAEQFGSRLSLIAQAHAGAYAARNRGVAHARGELIAFIDSDDAWLPQRLALQVPRMSRPEVGLVFGDTVHVTAPYAGAPRTGTTSFRLSPPRRGRVAAHFAWCNFVPTCTVLVRRRCLEEIGGFSEAALAADYLAWFRIALRHELDYVDAAVAEYTVHRSGISYDLGRSLAARSWLFAEELERTADPAVRAVLRRLLFNLALHRLLAAARGRARGVGEPLRLAMRAARLAAAPWTAAFALHQMRVRARRLFG